MNKLEANAIALKRWRTRLKRALTAIDKLERQRKRLEKAACDVIASPKRPEPKQTPAPQPIESAPSYTKDPDPDYSAPHDDLAIPTFLQRKKLDPIAEQIKAEQDERKQAKARGRIAKMKAKRSGDLAKMPLTGKAALAAIRG